MLPPGVELILFVLFLALHSLFSLAETSVLNVRKSKLKEMLEKDQLPERVMRRAKILLEFKVNPEHFIATVQTGSVLSGFLAATFMALFGYEVIAPIFIDSVHLAPRTGHALALGIAIFVATLLDLTFGALIPKSVALHNSERVAFPAAELLGFLTRLLKPITHLPVVISNLILKPFRDRTSFIESRISEDEFRLMLEEGARSGAIDKTENELIENIFDFRDRTAREIMVPRIKMVAIDADSPREKVIDRIISEGYTRLPVYKDTIDNILGVIYSKDVLALIEHPQMIVLYDIIRPAPFVPETKLLAELLREFQIGKHHMAIVLDEFGGTAGLITLEDILEEIVGEIHDEYDEDAPVVQIDEATHSATLSSNYSIADANEQLEKLFPDFQIPDDEEYESVSGYVNKLFGYIPEVGEERETHGVKIVVQKRAPNRVLQVRFEALPELENALENENETA
jgi:CBS domain containing-hemolysin-like protein